MTFCEPPFTQEVMATAKKGRNVVAVPKPDPRNPGKWMFTLDLPGVPPAPGEKPKRRQVQRKGFASMKAAQAAMDDLRVDARQGRHVDKTTITVEEYLTGWIERLEGKVRPSTAASYASTMRLHVIPYVGNVELQALSPLHLDDLYAKLRKPGANLRGRRDADGKMADPKPLSPRTIRYVHVVLKKALTEAVNHGLRVDNPATKVEAPKHDYTLPTDKVWAAGEVRTFLAHSVESADRESALWQLIATTGMRRGEALGLQIGDVDLDGAKLTIRRTVITVNYEVSEGTPKTKAGHRTIPLDTHTVASLRSHLAMRAAERLQHKQGKPKAGDWIFADPLGRPLHPDRVSKRFDKLVDGLVAKGEVRRISLHGLRHTWASLAIEHGEDVGTVQMRLGHSSPDITLRWYVHISKPAQARSAQRVADLFAVVSPCEPTAPTGEAIAGA